MTAGAVYFQIHPKQKDTRITLSSHSQAALWNSMWMSLVIALSFDNVRAILEVAGDNYIGTSGLLLA